ncbi:MAG: adenosylcobinamide-GDP ribazoletransferase [Alicyclobacillus sp.]|nr:adenosylcobinamide-GDP ribazoletransferase [Alicyclobacillus sp.]
MALVRWLILALQFATVLPLPAVSAQARDVRWSMAFFPLAGALLGAVAWGVRTALTPHLSAFAGAVVALALYTLATGALHLDGWMDVADGLACRKPPAEALAVMRDSRIGAAGAVAGGVLLLGQVSALANLPPQQLWAYLLPPACARLMAVWAMCRLPAAQADGVGAQFAGHVPRGAALLAELWPLAVSLAWLVWGGQWLSVLRVWLVSLAGGWAWTFWLCRRFGGLTGDMYGALIAGLEWLGWLAGAWR